MFGLLALIFIFLPHISNGLLIGVGKFDITGPIVRVDFMGYGDPFQTGNGLHLRLYSRAFIFQADASSKPVLFISLDAGMASQLMKTQLVRLLQEEYGKDVFDHKNVMISATHTHSGPGGYFQYLLYDITTFGFSNDTFVTMTAGILESVKQAYKSRTPGQILYASGTLKGASINRSPFSYLQNPVNERKLYSSNVDETMHLIKLVGSDGRELGMINWFPVHATSMNRTNRLVSSDNKGLASVLFEQWKKDTDGNDKFVAAFAQANEGDVSPNTRGANCVDTGEQCDLLSSTCSDGKVQNCIAYGPGMHGDMFESTRIIGQLQFEKARELYTEARLELFDDTKDAVEFRHQFVNMTSYKVTYDTNGNKSPKTGKTCLPALGYSFGAGTTDGPGVSDFTQGMLKGKEPWLFITTLLTKITEEMIECHAPKPILLPTGLMNYPIPWHPSIVETQIFKIGSLVIIGLPGEFTTMSGRRIARAVSTIFPENSVIVLAGLTNLYTHYVTTLEEYQVQRYEGASTIYGPHTLQAYIQQFRILANSIMEKGHLVGGPEPPFLLNRMFGITLPGFFDIRPPFHSFGEVWKAPKNVYRKVDKKVTVEFITGDPRNNFRTNATHLTIEKKEESGDWVVVHTDADWETKFTWTRRVHLFPPWFYVAEIEWTFDSPFRECQPGTYRIRHFGTSRGIHGKHDFEGETEAFTVLC
ncbi:unnamed protein product [Hymenolepis diminuta]|uniref:Neutral ceramidase n=1 Tax=Hymenolepis diminuta TaxID=6216 RepID=A0A158QBZ0_HYMDI|nr:unnamed protein product [Hymenolepis diminuta]